MLLTQLVGEAEGDHWLQRVEQQVTRQPFLSNRGCTSDLRVGSVSRCIGEEGDRCRESKVSYELEKPAWGAMGTRVNQ